MYLHTDQLCRDIPQSKGIEYRSWGRGLCASIVSVMITLPSDFIKCHSIILALDREEILTLLDRELVSNCLENTISVI